MQEDLIKICSDQTSEQFQSIIQLNSLLLTNLEQGVDFQLKAINSCYRINIEHVLNIAEFNGLEDLQNFSKGSSRITESFNKPLSTDIERATILPQELISDTEHIWQIL